MLISLFSLKGVLNEYVVMSESMGKGVDLGSFSVDF
jgi:hypothetical protein